MSVFDGGRELGEWAEVAVVAKIDYEGCRLALVSIAENNLGHLLITRNTTPAKPREVRFGFTWFVCDLKFQGWCSKSGPKAIHIMQVILYMNLLLTILKRWKMAASSVLTVN